MSFTLSSGLQFAVHTKLSETRRVKTVVCGRLVTIVGINIIMQLILIVSAE